MVYDILVVFTNHFSCICIYVSVIFDIWWWLWWQLYWWAFFTELSLVEIFIISCGGDGSDCVDMSDTRSLVIFRKSLFMYCIFVSVVILPVCYPSIVSINFIIYISGRSVNDFVSMVGVLSFIIPNTSILYNLIIIVAIVIFNRIDSVCYVWCRIYKTCGGYGTINRWSLCWWFYRWRYIAKIVVIGVGWGGDE